MNSSDNTGLRHPEWARNANIYEVNIRQYTPEGSFSAFESHLERLKGMGVDILWLMPIHPVGVKNRKGTLGSGYALSDYLAVNPEFGTLDDFKRLVKRVHELGMYLILDWVANHTAWDNKWVDTHPDWYKKDAAGQIHSYVFDHGGGPVEYWTDVIGLDYAQPGVNAAMLDALVYWVEECDIDGYRCDVAGLVPTLFWENARAVLDEIKPVFMLAEWSDPLLHRAAFDMTYDWNLYVTMTRIAAGQGDARDLVNWLDESRKTFPRDAYRMLFTSNHDKNTWEGSDTERYGPSFRAFAVLAATLPGMPMIYSGQETVLDKRIDFFEKDTIDWKNHELAEFYTGLLQLKKRKSCLRNGADGADAEVLGLGNDSLFGFRRGNEHGSVTVVVNLSDRSQAVECLSPALSFSLEAWAYEIIES